MLIMHPSKAREVMTLRGELLWAQFPRVYFLNDYSWIGRPIRADKKIFYQQTRRVTTLSKPPLESSLQEDSKSALPIFV